MDPKAAKQWFGVAPPDLSVVARSRGADWLYTYLRTFYRDPKTATGLEQRRVPECRNAARAVDAAGRARLRPRKAAVARRSQQGALSQVEYDTAVRDLVNFLAYVGEPAASERKAIGIVVLFMLGILFIFTYCSRRNTGRT